MSRYNLRNRTNKNSSQKDTKSESLSQKAANKIFPLQPPGLPIPVHLLPPVAEEPVLRPPVLSEGSVPHLGDKIAEPDDGPIPPTDVEELDSLSLIRPNVRSDDLDASIENVDPSSTSLLSEEYMNVLNSMSTLSLNNEGEIKSSRNETYFTALYSINTIEEENISQSVNQYATEDENSNAEIENNEADTSNNKGKTTNPLNWGNLEIPEEEMDIETQKRILSEAKRIINRKAIGPKDTSTPRLDNRAPKRSLQSQKENPRIDGSLKTTNGLSSGIGNFIKNNYEMNRERSQGRNNESSLSGIGISKPIDLINPKSYLGMAFNELRQRSVGTKKVEKTTRHSERTKRKSKRTKHHKSKTKKKRSRSRRKQQSENSPISIPTSDDSTIENTPENSDQSSCESGQENSSLYSYDSSNSESSETESDDSEDDGNKNSYVAKQIPNTRSLFKPIPPENMTDHHQCKSFSDSLSKLTNILRMDERPPSVRCR
jgi:hypothetical protein